MPTMPISHFTWQVLRAAKRSKTPLTGKQLRLVPSRKTKDGTFLDELVTAGLFQAVGVDELTAQSTDQEKRLPVQFRTRYKLTPLGEHAAEYGEYDREVKRP
ncbi:MAG: hypothetical protein J0I06_09845 [Planctomycetes bacterium]|nr:hypothetical protein [Planctomycetota bacterium]